MKNNLKSAVAFFFLFFLHGFSIGNGQQGISYNGLQIHAVSIGLWEGNSVYVLLYAAFITNIKNKNMNAKEKANELFNKYFSELRLPSDCEGCMQCVDRCGNMVAVAKKYALIAVEEILTRMIGSRAYSFNEKLFWSEVKSELQSL